MPQVIDPLRRAIVLRHSGLQPLARVIAAELGR